MIFHINLDLFKLNLVVSDFIYINNTVLLSYDSENRLVINNL